MDYFNTFDFLDKIVTVQTNLHNEKTISCVMRSCRNVR